VCIVQYLAFAVSRFRIVNHMTQRLFSSFLPLCSHVWT